ncbi:MAG: porin family protein [Candidatus Aminicenantales bacterium]
MAKRFLFWTCWLGVFSCFGLVSLSAKPKLTFGMKAGYTSGQLRAQEAEGDFEVEKMALGGFLIGALAEIRLADSLSFQPELIYFQKGGQYNVKVPVPIPDVSINVSDVRRLNYIEIPLLLQLTIPLRSSFRPTLLVGPSLGINLTANLKSKIRIKVPGFQFFLDEKKDIRREANDQEWSFIIGGGFNLRLPKGKLVLDQRFSFGINPNHYQVLVPASKFSALGFPMTEDMTYELKMQNYVFALSLGYLF